VLAAEHLLGLARFDLGPELVEPRRQVFGDRFAGLRPFGEDGEVLDAPLQRVAEGAVQLERLAALQQLLRRRLVLPEIGIGNALLYPREFVGGTGGVKDSSADRTRAWRGPGIGGAARLAGWWPYVSMTEGRRPRVDFYLILRRVATRAASANATLPQPATSPIRL
jgi:hypothetical protein